jgi:hypothetical protein
VSASRRGRVQLVIAVLSAVGCVASWLSAKAVVGVAPVIDGEPATLSAVFDPRFLTLAFLLAATAGVLAVLGLVNVRRGRRHSSPDTP